MKQQCLVKFPLGKHYADEAWCDVIPMTICHMLLRRPWLYDRKVFYDGFTNTYSFKFKGRKLVLDPLHISEFKAEKEVWPFLTMRQFTQVMQEDKMVFMLISREKTEDDNTIPMELSNMLQKFQDVMPDEIPRQLPPMKEI